MRRSTPFPSVLNVALTVGSGVLIAGVVVAATSSPRHHATLIATT